MSHAELNTRLRHLRLSGMVEALPARAQQASAGPLSHVEFLELLVEDELVKEYGDTVALEFTITNSFG